MTELIPAFFSCAFCGEQNETLTDPSGGNPQTYIEDCSVCCHPNVLHISFSSTGEAVIETEYEG